MSNVPSSKTGPGGPPPDDSGAGLDLKHLRREARTALELAIVALAPSNLVDELATAAGFLEALTELPADSPPVTATAPRVVPRARTALREWNAWHQQHLGKRIPLG